MKFLNTSSLLLLALNLYGQLDVTKIPLVYQAPGVDKVIVEKGNAFKTSGDTTVSFDIYYPPGFNKKSDLPLVIFNNGVGGNDLPTWKIYNDWARLIAVNGMIAVNHQSRRGKTQKDSEDLVDFLRQHAAGLHIDKERIGIWACSGNVGIGMPLAMQPDRRYIRSLVMYYGGAWTPEGNVVSRTDLDILVVRAGLDFLDLNRNLENFVADGMKKDTHIQFINYPEGQHAFDALDDNDRSREIVIQTVTFLKQSLRAGRPANDAFVLTTLKLWSLAVDEKKTTEAMSEWKKAKARYDLMPNHSPWFNHVIDERTVNQIGYALMNSDRLKDAMVVFKTVQESFPNSPNAHDALGDAYEKAGDRANAVAQAKLALEKLDASQLNAQRKLAIRENAEGKIKRLGN